MTLTDKELIEKINDEMPGWDIHIFGIDLINELIKRFKEREKPESEKELLMKFMQWHSGDETMSAERTQEIEKIVDIWLSPEPIIDNKTASWYKALELSKKIHSGEYKIEDSFNKLINPQTDGE